MLTVTMTQHEKRDKSCDPGRPLQESPGPSGPGTPKSLRESPGVEKVSKTVSKQSQNTLKTVSFETPEIVLRLFRTLFRPLGRKAPETLSETPVRGGRVCKTRDNTHKDATGVNGMLVQTPWRGAP